MTHDGIDANECTGGVSRELYGVAYNKKGKGAPVYEVPFPYTAVLAYFFTILTSSSYHAEYGLTDTPKMDMPA